jgi:hypothetical protein
MSLLRIARASPVGLVLTLLLVGCGTQSSSSATESTASQGATEPAASPAAEGTGPESPQPAGNGGPAVSYAQLPVGGTPVLGEGGNDWCYTLALNVGPPYPSGVAVTVTAVDVTTPDGGPQFTLADGSGCGGTDNQCIVGFKFSGGSGCNVDVKWDPNNPPTANGSLVVNGKPDCTNVDTTTCQLALGQLKQQGKPLQISAPSGGSPSAGSS